MKRFLVLAFAMLFVAAAFYPLDTGPPVGENDLIVQMVDYNYTAPVIVSTYEIVPVDQVEVLTFADFLKTNWIEPVLEIEVPPGSLICDRGETGIRHEPINEGPPRIVPWRLT